MARLSVACVLRKSKVFDLDYVERLRACAADHLPGVPFASLTDVETPGRIPLRHDWPGWWSKLELCAPWIEGDLLYFDLDTILIGDCSNLAKVGRLTMLSDFHVPDRLASGVMYLPEAERAEAWKRWIVDPNRHMDRAGAFGDGGFFASTWGIRAARWQEMLPGQIVSYKVHVREKKHSIECGNGSVPAGARVVCFHGKPRPRDIGWTL